jgi:MoaA/NifB/PqqE/SkfB family radical SAM enzyme
MELMEDGTTIEQQMFAMAAEKKVPLYGVLELLPLCNLNCDMCYVRMSREEMEEVGGCARWKNGRKRQKI